MPKIDKRVVWPSPFVVALILMLYVFGIWGLCRLLRSQASGELKGWGTACAVLGIPIPILQLVPGIAGACA